MLPGDEPSEESFRKPSELAELASLQQAYGANAPMACGIAHHNFASELQSSIDNDADVTNTVVAHLVAAAVILDLLDSCHLQAVIRALATRSLPATPPDLGTVVRLIEESANVPVRQLFQSLDADETGCQSRVRDCWQRALQMRLARSEALAKLPLTLREALKSRNAAAVVGELNRLSSDDLEATFQQLQLTGILDQNALNELQALHVLETLAQLFANSVLHPEVDRSNFEPALSELERHGWRIRSALERMWLGERSLKCLAENMDGHAVKFIGRVLDLVKAQDG